MGTSFITGLSLPRHSEYPRFNSKSNKPKSSVYFKIGGVFYEPQKPPANTDTIARSSLLIYNSYLSEIILYKKFDNVINYQPINRIIHSLTYGRLLNKKIWYFSFHFPFIRLHSIWENRYDKQLKRERYISTLNKGVISPPPPLAPL